MSEAAAIMGPEGARSLGAQLAAAREKSGLSVERVSSETHIPVQRLREIERDDFSHFSHPSYARMFAIDYAKYLGIPVSRVRRLLPDAGECGAEGYQYLQETPCNYMQTDIRPFRRRRPLMPKLVAATMLVLSALGGLKLWTTLRDIERLGLDRLPHEETNAQQTASSVTERPSDSALQERGQSPAPPSEGADQSAMESDTESPLLVGADLDHSDRIR